MVKVFKSDKYNNITVSGRVASGATTLSRYLAESLGWKLWNGGELYRHYVKERNIPLELTSMVSDEFHEEFDVFIRNKLKNERNQILESWLAGYDARSLPKILKVFLTCSDDSVRVDRLVNRDKLTIEEAIHHMKVREAENLLKWKKIYKTDDFWNEKYYNLIIDTYKYGPRETLNIVLEKLKFE